MGTSERLSIIRVRALPKETTKLQEQIKLSIELDIKIFSLSPPIPQPLLTNQ